MLLLALMICSISSCKNDLDSLEGGNHRSQRSKEKPKLKTFCLSFGGDLITEEDEPLLRAETGDTLVGINVFYTNKDEEIDDQPYAYGLFPRTDKIYIDLYTGSSYRFETSIVIEEKDKIWDNGNGRYQEPFIINNGVGPFEKDDMGEFLYTYNAIKDAKYYFTNFKYGTALVDAGGDLPSQYGQVHFPRVKRFCGEVKSFDPSISPFVEIPMDYKCFGLKFILNSIPEGTQISVMDQTNYGDKIFNTDNSHPEYFLRFPKKLWLNNNSEDSKTWEGIFSLYDLTKDTQQFNLRFFWYKGGEQPYETFDYPITVTAKQKKVLKLDISGEPNLLKTGNIIISPLVDTLEEEEAEEVNHDFNKK